MAIGILVFTVLLVYLDRGGYRDANDPHPRQVDLVDAIYYTTVTLSTTGYGDIAPYAAHARLINAFVITPLRIAFLVLLIGTTLEVLASQGREMFRVARWRKNMDEHVVVIGYGTKGRSAVDTLVNNGTSRDSVVVVDPGSVAQEEAHADGLAVVTGDATRREVLRRAGVDRAQQVIITTARDDTTVLATLTVRQLNPDAYIVAAVRESDNVPLVRQSGADSVITSSDAVGRLLGLASFSPNLGSVMEDLLTYGEGLEVAQRDLLVNEVGKAPQSLPDQVIAVVRDEKVYRYFDPTVTLLARGDELIVVRPAKELPWAPRPGTHNEAGSDEDDRVAYVRAGPPAPAAGGCREEHRQADRRPGAGSLLVRRHRRAAASRPRAARPVRRRGPAGHPVRVGRAPARAGQEGRPARRRRQREDLAAHPALRRRRRVAGRLRHLLGRSARRAGLVAAATTAGGCRAAGGPGPR